MKGVVAVVVTLASACSLDYSKLRVAADGGAGDRTGDSVSGGSGGAAGGEGRDGAADQLDDVRTCETQTLTFGLRKAAPDLMVVQNKSRSMDQTPDGMTCGPGGCGAMSKWAQMTAAINQVVMQTETQIRWGLKYFPDSGSCGVGAMPAVPIAP